MKLGTTFFERTIPPRNREDHLHFLQKSGFQSVEFCVHDRLMPKQEIFSLMKTAAKLPLEVSFHSPDFIDPESYSLKQFLNDEKAFTVYQPYLFELANLQLNGGKSQKIIFHSIPSESLHFDFEGLMSLNMRALDTLLNFIVRENLPFDILLENTCPLDEPTLGSNPKFLTSVLQAFSGSPLALCLDLPHWYRTHQPEANLPDESINQDAFNETYLLSDLLLDAVSYSHLHGITGDFCKSHLPLKDEQFGFIDFVKAFSLKKDQIIFNLEIFDLEGMGNIYSYESLLLQHIKKIENY